MKTPEQIARECIAKMWKLVWWHNRAPSPEYYVLKAINEALEQERNRTCEWVKGDFADAQWFTQCGKERFAITPDMYGPRCADCGGKIVVKGEKK